MNKPMVNGTVTRWFLLLQEFNITISNNHGKNNIFINVISILKYNEYEHQIEDIFLY